MKYLSTLFVLIIILIGCAKNITSNVSSAVASSKPSVVSTVAKEASLHANAMMVAGKQIFTTKCTRCHEIIPAENYTAIKWVNIMQSMAANARLDSTEKANVLLYVKFNAKAIHS